MLPEGRYDARGIEAALAKTSNGNTQVAVLFEILNPEHQGERITWYGSFAPTIQRDGKSVAQRTVAALMTCGWTGDDLSDLSGIGANEVSLVVKHDEYNGQVTAKVAFVNAPGGLAINAPLPAEEAKAFAAHMRGVVASVRQGAPKGGNGTSATRRPPPRPATHDPMGDDVPW